MGYSYGWTSSGRQALACDGCGESEGRTRKRTCPHEVLNSSLWSSGRYALPWCPAPAYCPACFKERGGTKGVHSRCAEAAAADQAREDAIEAALEAGEKFVTYAYGDWAEGVPKGFAKVGFEGRGGKVEFFIPSDSYDPGQKKKLSDYPEAVAA